ncbi:hypothetical protein [Halomonas sp. I5-271120]|uniref:hypothetical protein n=1 Tax=Halomonas sp. I5-271120 TaxID=3061632 RepID=UPI00271518DF|nr:hypothetical protein [Halomonas sp. I5-271120]
MTASEFDQHPELGTDFWGEHPEHPLDVWQSEVADDDTRLGYWAWVLVRIEQEEEDEESEG